MAQVSRVKGVYIGRVKISHDEIARINGVYIDGDTFQSQNEPTNIEIYKRVERIIKYYDKINLNEVSIDEFQKSESKSNLSPIKITEYVFSQNIIPQILAKIETRLPEFIMSMQSIDGDLFNPAVYYYPRQVWLSTLRSILGGAGALEEETGLMESKTKDSECIFSFKIYDFDNSKISIYITDIKSGQKVFSREVFVGKGIKQGCIEEIESQVEDLIVSISNEIKPIITKERPDYLTYLKMLDLLRGLEMNLNKVDSKVSTLSEYRASLNQVKYMVKAINFEVELKEKESKNNI